MKKTPLSSNMIAFPKTKHIGQKINGDIIDRKTKEEREEEEEKKKRDTPTSVVPIVRTGGKQTAQPGYRRKYDPWAKKEVPPPPPNAEVVNTGPTSDHGGGHEAIGPDGKPSVSGGVTTGKVTGTTATGKSGGLVRGHGISRTRNQKAKW